MEEVVPLSRRAPIIFYLLLEISARLLKTFLEPVMPRSQEQASFVQIIQQHL